MSNEMELYKDPLSSIALSLSPMAKGHLTVHPARADVKKIEELDDKELEHLFYCSSYAATGLFELLGAHGTNIILNEDEDILTVDIISRMQDDGLNFLWEPSEMSQPELSDSAKKLKDAVEHLIWERDNPEEAKKAKAPKQEMKIEEIKEEEGKVNYLLKSLRRIP